MKTVIVLAMIFSGCSYFDKKPTAQKFSDTDKCPDACKHIQELGCAGWTTETELQECIEFCETTQENGHHLDPNSVLEETDCTEFSPASDASYAFDMSIPTD